MKIKPRISIIEQDDSLRNALRDTLISNEFGVSTYSCAEDFLAQGNFALNDLILSDVNMNGMSGLELLKQIKDLNSCPPVILMSGSCFLHKEGVLKLGAAAFLSKPFHLTELLLYIQFCISASRPA